MKAVVVEAFGGPEQLRVRDLPDPEPGMGQVLLEVRAAGVNPVEAYIRSGAYARKPALPYIPGTDAAGVVVRADASTGYAPGDRVYAFGRHGGAYATRLVADPAGLRRLPASTSFAQGAALGVPYATAQIALFLRGRARRGETVLVHGASGGVGQAAVQFAAAAGLRVVATASSPAGRAFARAQGAELTLDHASPDHADALLEATGGKGFDVILEMAAHAQLGRDLGALARGGRVVVVGSRGPVEVEPRALMTRDASVTGMTLFNATPEELAAAHDAIVRGLQDGTLRPVIGGTYPLERAAEAHQAVLDGPKAGKIILETA